MSRAAGLVLGHLLDRVVGDPRRGHPVAAFGRTASAVEEHTYADSRAAGAAHSLVLVGGTVALGVAVERATRRRPAPHTLATAAATWAVLGGTTLGREAVAVRARLDRGDLPAARQQLTHLVGRSTDSLSADEVSRAVVESVAENTSDAVVAPLVWGALLGVPGLVGHRAANTLDAMVGHRGARYGRFGWASARLDDLLNLPGARLSALLAAGLAPSLAGSPREALGAWRRDAGAHPSPNAGVVEAAFAGALGVQLGGRNHYAHGAEDRVRLGRGRAPAAYDIGRSVTLSRRVGAAAVVLAAGASLVTKRARDRAVRPYLAGTVGRSTARPTFTTFSW